MSTSELYKIYSSKLSRALVLAGVHSERERQDKLHPEVISLRSQFIVLMEEVGEVAEALQPELGIPGTKETDKANLYEELIQVAAVATRMAESVMHSEHAKH